MIPISIIWPKIGPEGPNRLNRGPNRTHGFNRAPNINEAAASSSPFHHSNEKHSKGEKRRNLTLTIPSNYHNFLIRAPIAAPFAATRSARRALPFYPNNFSGKPSIEFRISIPLSLVNLKTYSESCLIFVF